MHLAAGYPANWDGERGQKVYVHRLRAERALGKPLPPKAEVHHADGTRDDDGPLVICEDRAYHMLLHVRLRVRRLGGDPNTDKWCPRCESIKPRTEFHVGRAWSDGLTPICKPCARAHSQRYRRKGVH